MQRLLFAALAHPCCDACLSTCTTPAWLDYVCLGHLLAVHCAAAADCGACWYRVATLFPQAALLCPSQPPYHRSHWLRASAARRATFASLLKRYPPSYMWLSRRSFLRRCSYEGAQGSHNRRLLRDSAFAFLLSCLHTPSFSALGSREHRLRTHLQ